MLTATCPHCATLTQHPNSLNFCSQQCEDQWADANFDVERFYGNDTPVASIEETLAFFEAIANDPDLCCGGELIDTVTYGQ